MPVVHGMTNPRTFQSMNRSGHDPEASANRNSCLLMLVIYVVLSVVYTRVLQTQLEGAAVPLALVLAIFGTLFLASAISVVVWPGEVRWLRSAMRGEWPDDGALCAVTGRLEGEARPAPISGEPALAWSIDVYKQHYSAVQKRTVRVFKLKGMGRRPVVLHGPAGQVHLAGLLELDSVKEKRWSAGEVMPQVGALKHYGKHGADVQAFSESLAGPGAALDDFATSEESYEKVRFNASAGVTPDDQVEERLLQPGQQICAIGIFDRRTVTLKGRRVLGVERIQIMPGGPRRAAARMMRRTILGLVAMTVLFLLSHGLIGALVFL